MRGVGNLDGCERVAVRIRVVIEHPGQGGRGQGAGHEPVLVRGVGVGCPDRRRIDGVGSGVRTAGEVQVAGVGGGDRLGPSGRRRRQATRTTTAAERDDAMVGPVRDIHGARWRAATQPGGGDRRRDGVGVADERHRRQVRRDARGRGRLVDGLAAAQRSARGADVAVAEVVGGHRMRADREGGRRQCRLVATHRLPLGSGAVDHEVDGARGCPGSEAADGGREGHALAPDRRMMVGDDDGRTGGRSHGELAVDEGERVVRRGQRATRAHDRVWASHHGTRGGGRGRARRHTGHA